MDGIFDKLEKEKGSSLTNTEKANVLKLLDIPKNDEGYYLDAFGNSCSYNGIRTLKRPYTKLPLTQDHLTEIQKCSEDLFYFVRNYCRILTKTGVTFPEFRQYQIDFLKKMSSGNDVVASVCRQAGKSVSVGLYLLWRALFTKDINIGICANKLSLATEVLDKIKKIFIQLPIWLQQGLEAWNKTYIIFENGTRIMTSAGDSDAFRGYSIHIMMIDECAFISNTNWQGIQDSVFPSQEALSQKQKVLVSTPNGMNHWYHLVQQAKRENSGYEYFTMDWREVPRYKEDGSKIDPEEYKREKIKKEGKLWFAQNFELAFLGSSNTLIESTALQNLIPQDEDQIIFNSLFSGLRIFEKPIDGHSYIIGVDPAKEGIDKTAIQVLDVTVLPFKQVACANLDDSYLTIPAKLFDLGQYYNWAMVVVENNIDNSIVDSLSFNYEYEGEIFREKGKNLLGFRTTTKTKKQMLSLLKKLIEEDKFKIADKATIDELFVFVQQKNGSFSAQDGYHDDLVMALCIALVPFLNVKRFDDFKGFIELIEKRNEEIKKEEESFLELYLDLGLNNSTPRNNSTNFSEPIIYTDSNPFGFKYQNPPKTSSELYPKS